MVRLVLSVVLAALAAFFIHVSFAKVGAVVDAMTAATAATDSALCVKCR